MPRDFFTASEASGMRNPVDSLRLMKRTRTSLAVLAILVLVAAAVLPGGAAHDVVLAVTLLLVPFTLTATRLWVSAEPGRFDSPHRSLVLLRGPPAHSIQR
jgi:hypothetical protein